jgi:hypothetical protein
VSDARSSQRLYNYVTAQEILDFRNAPTSKFLVGAAAMAGHENQYRDVTDPDITTLSFNEYDESGAAVKPSDLPALSSRRFRITSLRNNSMKRIFNSSRERPQRP